MWPKKKNLNWINHWKVIDISDSLLTIYWMKKDEGQSIIQIQVLLWNYWDELVAGWRKREKTLAIHCVLVKTTHFIQKFHQRTPQLRVKPMEKEEEKKMKKFFKISLQNLFRRHIEFEHFFFTIAVVNRKKFDLSQLYF